MSPDFEVLQSIGHNCAHVSASHASRDDFCYIISSIVILLRITVLVGRVNEAPGGRVNEVSNLAGSSDFLLYLIYLINTFILSESNNIHGVLLQALVSVSFIR